MYSKVKIFGHPVHPMLVAFPVAFYTAAMVGFLVFKGNGEPFWFKVAVAANIAGVVMAVLAALPVFFDWLTIPSKTIAKRTGAVHLSFIVAALVLFAANAYMLYDQWNTAQPCLRLALPLTIAGFLGWTLVQTYHVGISERLDQPEAERETEITDPEMGRVPL